MSRQLVGRCCTVLSYITDKWKHVENSTYYSLHVFEYQRGKGACCQR